MEFWFEPGDSMEMSEIRAQPKYDRLVMRGSGRFYLEGTLPTGEPFSVQLGPSDSSAGGARSEDA
jgi:hypothetical protein